MRFFERAEKIKNYGKIKTQSRASVVQCNRGKKPRVRFFRASGKNQKLRKTIETGNGNRRQIQELANGCR